MFDDALNRLGVPPDRWKQTAVAPPASSLPLFSDARAIQEVSSEKERIAGLGVGKSRLTHRGPVPAGMEILLIGTGTGVLGFLLGAVLPQLLGAPVA